MKKSVGLGIIGAGAVAIVGGIITLLKGGNVGLPQVNGEADELDEDYDYDFEEEETSDETVVEE